MSFVMTRMPGSIGALRGGARSGVSAAASAATLSHASPETPSTASNGIGSLTADGYQDPVSDSLLAARAAQGDRQAFGELVERYQRPMAALVARMTASPDDVDDIVQELFIRAWKGLPRFRGDAQFSTWLYRIAVNTAIKHRSRRRNESTLSLSAEDMVGGVDALRAETGDSAQGGDPFESAAAREQEQIVRRAVHSLPEKQREVVALHYFEGRSCEEISQIIDCSVGTVWSRLHYACKRLKGLLEAAS